jgi:hypothetical protein
MSMDSVGQSVKVGVTYSQDRSGSGVVSYRTALNPEVSRPSTSAAMLQALNSAKAS